MAKKTINIKGTSGANYNLDEIASDSRTNSTKNLLVQVHRYKRGESPNPANPQVGQIWLSQMVEDTGSKE